MDSRLSLRESSGPGACSRGESQIEKLFFRPILKVVCDNFTSSAGGNGKMPSFLSGIVRCPQHPEKGRLSFLEAGNESNGTVATGRIKCLECGLVYPVINGIADMFAPLQQGDGYAFLEAESRQWHEHSATYEATRSDDLLYELCLNAGLRALDAQQGELILDAGCGTGMGTRRLRRAGPSLVALDLSLQSLVRLNKEAKDGGVTCVRGDVGRLPFADNTFDKLICANTLQHVPSWDLRQRSVAEFARVVKPGGRVVVTVHGYSISKKRAGWEKEGAAHSRSGDVQYIYRYDVPEFRDLLARNLRIERITGAGLPLPYRLKLTPVSKLLEGFLSRVKWSAPCGHMLIGKCAAK
jgi:SAM-dependent methyltransferase